MLNLPDELRVAQQLEQVGRGSEALSRLCAVADIDDPFVPWIWYNAATMAERAGQVERLIEYSRRFNTSPLTAEPDYRTAHVDLLVKRIVRLCQARQPAGDDVDALMRFEPSRHELDPIYAHQLERVLPQLEFMPADEVVELPWRRWRAPLSPIRLGSPHYAIDKRPHDVPVPRLHTARRATYVTTGSGGGLWKGQAWCSELGTGPSVAQALRTLQARGNAPVQLPGRALIIGDQFTPDNYCHWTVDWIPRALFAAEFGGGFDWLFLRGTRKPFQLDWLRLLGIDPFHVIFEDGLAWYRMDEFIYSDSGNIAVTHPAYGGHPEVVRRVRAAARPAPVAGRLRRVFISRRDGGGRGILNEVEVLDLIVRNGFEVVELSRLTLAEQVALFAGAEAAVGVHGAGLTNLLYMPPGAMVIELLHHRYGTNSFAMPSLKAGLRYAYLSCPGGPEELVPSVATTPANPTDFITAPLWVDTAQLARGLALI